MNRSFVTFIVLFDNKENQTCLSKVVPLIGFKNNITASYLCEKKSIREGNKI